MNEDHSQAERGSVAEGSKDLDEKDETAEAAAQSRKAIQDDIRSEEALRSTLEELEREADELEAARARRKAHLAAARRASRGRSSSHKGA